MKTLLLALTTIFGLSGNAGVQEENAPVETYTEPVVIEQPCDCEQEYQKIIDDLKQELSNKNATIDVLNIQISNLNDEVTDLKEQLSEKEEVVYESTIVSNAPAQNEIEEIAPVETVDEDCKYITHHSEKYDRFYHNYKDCTFIEDKESEAVDYEDCQDRRPCKCVYSGRFWE